MDTMNPQAGVFSDPGPKAAAPEPRLIAFSGGKADSSIEPSAVAKVLAARKGFVWVHLHRGHPATDGLLREMGLDSFVIDALMAEDTRPRFTVHGDGAILILRGVNLNEGQEPEDMVSVRFWIDARRLVGIWQRRSFAVHDVREAIGRGQVPGSPIDLVARIVDRLVDRAEPVVSGLSEKMDGLEQDALENRMAAIAQHNLVSIRQTASNLRRYMYPQRDALTSFAIEDFPWMGVRERSRIREGAERITRLAEELDAIGDRALIAHDQVLAIRAERMNRTMLVLTVVAAIFLPLTLLAGLLGMNVGGIPGSSDPRAFWIVCGLTVVLGVALWFAVRWARMID